MTFGVFDINGFLDIFPIITEKEAISRGYDLI
jgi:hypothetical protein